MKKYMVPLVISGLIVIGGVLVIVGKGNDDKSTNNSSTSTKTTGGYKIVSACDVLTQKVADEALGGKSEKGTFGGDNATDDINVSTCSYTRNTNTSGVYNTAKILNASLLARSAKTSTGADSNKLVFTGKPDGAQTVSGYGDDAYWAPVLGQFNILKHNNWYILTNGSAQVKNRTLEDAKKLADLIIDQL